MGSLEIGLEVVITSRDIQVKAALNSLVRLIRDTEAFNGFVFSQPPREHASEVGLLHECPTVFKVVRGALPERLVVTAMCRWN